MARNQTNEIADILAECLQISTVIGSRRYGVHRVDSDLDLLIVKADYFRIVQKLEKCDGVVMSKSSPVIDGYHTTTAAYVIFGINVNFIVTNDQSEYAVWYKAACALDKYIALHGSAHLVDRGNRIAAFEKCKALYRQYESIDIGLVYRVVSRMSPNLPDLSPSQPPTSPTPKIEKAREPATPAAYYDEEMPF